MSDYLNSAYVTFSQNVIQGKIDEISNFLPDLSNDPLNCLATAIALESIAAELRVKAACFQVNKSQNILGPSGDKSELQQG